MNCMETEQNIIPYINRKLTATDMLNFLEHIEECEKCRDELEIYYMLYVGYNSLETFDEPESYDLKGRMDREIKFMSNYIKFDLAMDVARRIFATAVIGILIIVFIEYLLM